LKHESVDFSNLDSDLQNKILNLEISPVDFLLMTILDHFPQKIDQIQKNEKMLTLGKEIRKRNFTKNLISKLDRLSLYFSLFFYESRNHPIWKSVLESLIKAPFTPDQLLKNLDVLFRQDVVEYQKFYSLLCQNTKLTRVIYLIESMQIDETENESSEEIQDDKKEEIMSISKLNSYSHYWFPDIVLTAIKHHNIFKTSLEKVYDELYKWKENLHLDNFSANILDFYPNKPPNPQSINPRHVDILTALLKHNKTSTRILTFEISNHDKNIRKIIALSEKANIKILTVLTKDHDEYIKKIALIRVANLKKEREMMRLIGKSSSDQIESEKENKDIVLSINYMGDVFDEKTDTYYY
jgi:hypothetical protein